MTDCEIQERFDRDLRAVAHIEDWKNLRVAFLGKKGVVTEALKNLKDLSPQEKVTQGQKLHALKKGIEEALSHKKDALDQGIIREQLQREALDLTRPPYHAREGSLHLIPETIEVLYDLCTRMGLTPVGFTPDQGPDVEHEDFNFTQLNIPDLHPARSMHDTFHIAEAPGWLLRTHTTPVDVRILQTMTPQPVRLFSMGRVYRSDHDATHLPMFHQLDGLCLGPKGSLTMAHLKTFLKKLLQGFFSQSSIEMRFRPSYFPFTEPSAEVDIKWGEKWMEILGCGMLHPQVLRHVGWDPEEYQGFAFGVGIERLVMLEHGIDDIRSLYAGDQRWLQQHSLPPAHWSIRTAS